MCICPRPIRWIRNVSLWWHLVVVSGITLLEQSACCCCSCQQIWNRNKLRDCLVFQKQKHTASLSLERHYKQTSTHKENLLTLACTPLLSNTLMYVLVTIFFVPFIYMYILLKHWACIITLFTCYIWFIVCA